MPARSSTSGCEGEGELELEAYLYLAAPGGLADTQTHMRKSALNRHGRKRGFRAAGGVRSGGSCIRRIESQTQASARAAAALCKSSQTDLEQKPIIESIEPSIFRICG